MRISLGKVLHFSFRQWHPRKVAMYASIGRNKRGLRRGWLCIYGHVQVLPREPDADIFGNLSIFAAIAAE